jgi:hypothetical protein
MSLTPRREDLGFTEEIRPFEVHGITVLGYDASLGNQHSSTLRDCAAFTFRGLQFRIWTWRWGWYVSQWHSIIWQKNKILNHTAIKSSKLQLSTSTVNSLPLSAFLILCCSHLDFDKGLGNCMALPTKTTQKGGKHTSMPKWNSNPWFLCFTGITQ